MNWKKISVFIVLLILVILLFNLLFRFVLPIKPVRTISRNMEPTYMKNDVLFYVGENNYQIDDVIVLETDKNPVVTRIISVNEDIYQAKADNNNIQLNFEKSIEKTRIKGKIVFSINPFIFYILLWGIQIIIAFLLTKPIHSKIIKK